MVSRLLMTSCAKLLTFLDGCQHVPADNLCLRSLLARMSRPVLAHVLEQDCKHACDRLP
jgi:hypothetical protein